MTAVEEAHFLPTRRSLLSRLKDWDNRDSWREFFNTYWRLIYDVARRAGLDDARAQDIVQETMMSVASAMPGFRYDAKIGSFKSWLRTVARRRIADSLRKRYVRHEADHVDAALTQIQEEIAGSTEACPLMDQVWDEEWRRHAMEVAMGRVKEKVRADHFQLFELTVLKGCAVGEVAKAMNMSLASAFVVRHRVGRMLKKEVARLEAQML